MSASKQSPHQAFIAAAGEGELQEYVKTHYPPALVALNCYQASDAENWLDLKQFMSWVSHRIQAKVGGITTGCSDSSEGNQNTSDDLIRSMLQSPPPTQKPATREISAISDDNDTDIGTGADMNGTARSFSPKLKSRKRKKKRSPNNESSSSDEVEIVNDAPAIIVKTEIRRTKKKRCLLKSDEIISVSSDSESDNQRIQITRQLTVRTLRHISEIPENGWVIEDDVAYLLDLSHLTDDDFGSSKKGGVLSMGAYIRGQDHESWGSGSGGSVNIAKAPLVLPLNQKCQSASFKCQGSYRCSEYDENLHGTERQARDVDEMREIFEAEREINREEHLNTFHSAAAFYKDALRKPCKAKVGEGQVCSGEAVYRKYKTKVGESSKDFDGKHGFIGCSGWCQTRKNDHRFMPIPRAVDEDLVKELFTRDGQFESLITTRACARILSPHHAGHGKKLCPYTHIRDGKVIEGKLIWHACPSELRIWFPLDRSDRRAIIKLSKAHNHPSFPSTKITQAGKAKYIKAVQAVGTSSATVLKIDAAPLTREIFGGTPASFDPALGITRVKSKIIREMRNMENPNGKGLEAVMFQQNSDKNILPKEKQYIHHTMRSADMEMVITMVPGLAERIHEASAIYHDNTYKRVAGDWKEWEVVIWDDRLNCRLTVARIYCTRETRIAYEKMWTGFWDTVEVITGKPIQFKFLDKKGLLIIGVDGSKPQVDGCGDALVKQMLKRKSPAICEKNPQLIVQYIIKTCDVHLERKFNEMQKAGVPSDILKRVRGFPFLETTEEVESFVEFCENSSHKIVRDWIFDKHKSPWFFSSVNKFMSKIPLRDWEITPGHTNLNESAHPYTNQHTGTQLPLITGIESARQLDYDQLEKIHLSEKNCIPPNLLNTKPERDRANRSRREARVRKATEKAQTMGDLDDLNTEIERLEKANKDAREQVKDLREKKKKIQQENGIKRTSPKKLNAQGKAQAQALLVAETNIMTETDSDTEPPNDATPSTPVKAHSVAATSTSCIVVDTETCSNQENIPISMPPSLKDMHITPSPIKKNLLDKIEASKTSQTYLSPTLAILDSLRASPPRPRAYESPLWRQRTFLPPPNVTPVRKGQSTLILDRELDPTRSLSPLSADDDADDIYLW